MKNKMVLLKEECKGCYMATRYFITPCFLYDIGMTDFDCPCFNCLVKVMCNISCEKIDKYFDFIQDKRKEKKNDTMQRVPNQSDVHTESKS